MSNIIKFQKLLKESNVIVSTADIQKILFLEFKKQQLHLRNLDKLGISSSVTVAGKVLGVIALGALGFVFLPGLIGVSAFMGALIAGAIGWRLFGLGKKVNTQQKQQRAISSPGFDSAPQPPQVGGVIPLVFTNKARNPQGGIRVTGNNLITYVNTYKNQQTLYQLKALGLGEIDFINPQKLLVDGQPLDNFLQDEVTVEYSRGTENQSRFFDFQYYSQAIVPSNNNLLGITFRATATSFTSNSFVTAENDFDSFSPTDIYKVNGQEFKITNKNAETFKFSINKTIANAGDRKIYSVSKIKYTTNKRCTNIDLNLLLNIWARNNDNELTNFAVLFDLLLDGRKLGRFCELNKKEGDLRRSIKLKNLSLTQHTIEIIPYEANDNQPCYRLDDSGILKNLEISGVLVEIESKETLVNLSKLNSALSLTNKPQTSSDRGSNCKLTSVNEIVKASDINQSALTNFKELVLAALKIKASERLQGSPSTSDLIEKGVVGRVHILAGAAGLASNQNTLQVFNYLLGLARPGYICRNLTRQTESVITSIQGNLILTQTSLFWQQQDNYLIYYLDSINYFPDVFVYTLTNKNCLGKLVGERYINYPSICEARKFCEDNQYFWDDVLDKIENWDAWVTQESLGSLLYPNKFAGIYGLVPEKNQAPVAVFTVSNISPGTYRQSKPDNTSFNTVQLTYQALIDEQRYAKTLTCTTSQVFNGLDEMETTTLTYESITTEAQAKKVAAKYLKSRLIQKQAVSFSTGIQGFSLREGEIIIVQYAVAEKETELSGFAYACSTFNNGSQLVELSKPLADLSAANNKATIYHLDTGTVEVNKPFQIVNSQLLISELTEVIKPKRFQKNGDIIIINREAKDKFYRVASIKPTNYAVEVSAVFWSSEIHNDSDLVYIT